MTCEAPYMQAAPNAAGGARLADESLRQALLLECTTQPLFQVHKAHIAIATSADTAARPNPALQNLTGVLVKKARKVKPPACIGSRRQRGVVGCARVRSAR